MFVTLFLGHLRPSRELLEYYRKKIAEYDDEHEQLVSKLDEYRVTYEEQVCDSNPWNSDRYETNFVWMNVSENVGIKCMFIRKSTLASSWGHNK